MKPHVVSLAAGIVIGAIYALISVRSPANPLIALAGVVGILVGEQRQYQFRRCVQSPLGVQWRPYRAQAPGRETSCRPIGRAGRSMERAMAQSSGMSAATCLTCDSRGPTATGTRIPRRCCKPAAWRANRSVPGMWAGSSVAPSSPYRGSHDLACSSMSPPVIASPVMASLGRSIRSFQAAPTSRWRATPACPISCTSDPR